MPPLPPPLPALPLDAWANIVAQADVESLFALRGVCRGLHRLGNREIQRLCLRLVEDGTANLDFDGMPIGTPLVVCFRGDTRAPSAIFGLGFTKTTRSVPHISGEKVRGVISTKSPRSSCRLNA